jgi:hypothetical protein
MMCPGFVTISARPDVDFARELARLELARLEPSGWLQEEGAFWQTMPC